MELKVNMKINDNQSLEFKFENEDLQKLIKQAGPILDFDLACDLCDNVVDFGLRTRTSKDGKYTYTEYVCKLCGATRNFGKHQDSSGYFLKEWKEKYTGE